MSDVGTIFNVWNRQGEGYVSIPRKLRSASSVKGPKNNGGKWEEKGSIFKWPDDLQKIKDYISHYHKEKYDLYWCPTILTGPRRVKENIKTVNILYADLDEVNPSSLSSDLRPSVAWESSPSRFAALWFLKEPLPPNEAETLNKSLTYFIGADKGGWDLTQVLRIPGTKNYKYENGPAGKLLWIEDRIISTDNIPLLPEEQAPLEVEEIELVDTDPDKLLSLVSSIKNKIKPSTLKLLISSEEDILLFDRSEVLWQLECQLLEQGISPNKVLELVGCSNWNKYRGRKDEIKRLQVEVDKALTHTGKVEKSSYQAREQKNWVSYSDLLSMQIDQPGWMIEGVWQRNSHGMIAGEPKTYKSVIATDMAVSVASGRPFLGKYPVNNPGPVMYIQEENSPWLVKDRITKIAHTRGLLNGSAEMNGSILSVKMPPELPMYFLNNMGFDFTNEEDRSFLEESIQQVNPVLIIFDPLYLMLGDRDENSSKDLRPVLNWLLHLRYTYHTSVIVLHHWNKSGKSERGGQRMLGSVLFHGWVESALYTKLVDESKHQIEVEREFRSFSKPENLNITFNFGEPGELLYKADVSNSKGSSSDQVYQLLTESRRLTIEDAMTALSITQKIAKKRLDLLVKQSKAILSNGIYILKEEE